MASEKNQAHLDAIITSAMDAIITVNDEQIIEIFNPAAEKMFGWMAVDIIGQSLDLLIPERFRQAHQQHIRGFGQNGITNRRMGNLGILYGLRADGTEFPLEASISYTKNGGKQLYTVILRDITQRLKQEISIRQSERRYRAMVEDLPVLICHYEPGYILTYVNDAYCQYYGQSRKELIGKSFLTLIPETEHQGIKQNIASLTVESPVLTYEHPVIAASGEVRWQHWLDRALFDDEGNVIVYHAIGQDITERKQTELALRESEDRYRSVVTALAEGIVLQDANGIILACNKSAEEILGLTVDQMMGRSSLDPRWRAIHEDGTPFPGETHPAMMTLKTGEAYINVIMGVHKPSGVLTWISVNSEPLINPGESKPYAVVASFTDITERKETEMQFQFQRTVLAAQLEASIDGILITSNEGKWLFYNQRLVDMWDIPAEIVETLSSQVAVQYLSQKYLNPEEIQANIQYLNEHPEKDDRMELTLKDGRIFDRYTAPVKGADGVIYGRLWSYRDVSDYKHLEEQLLQAQKMEAVGRLAGGIAHDFNNLLVPIISYAELGMMSAAPDSRLYSYMEHIVDATERAAAITQQILAFSRRQVLEMKTLDLNQIIINFQKMIQRLIGEDIEIATFLSPTLSFIRADKAQLEQVLMNLAINARDAMPDGGKLTLETLDVYLDEDYTQNRPEAEPGHYVMLAISDTGFGMDAETRQRIFEPFFTTKEMGKGTGLGLSTVFGIVKQHQGNIFVYSEPGQGTAFRIYLPQADADRATVVEATLIPTSAYGTEAILVVEDEDMVREVVCETLEAHGYKVIAANNPLDGLKLALEHKGEIDLLVTDVIMPDMNGRQLYQEIAQTSPQLKVLYMSGYTDNVIVHHGILDEGIHFLQKPFNVRDLTQKVRQALQQ